MTVRVARTRMGMATLVSVALASAALVSPGGPATAAPVVDGVATVQVAAASSAPARTLRGCVNRRTGQLRLIRKGKCRRGERRVTWSSNGPAGPAGPTGPTGPTGPRGFTPVVRDGSGTIVPDVVNVYTWGVQRLVNGGLITYWLNGMVSFSTIEEEYSGIYFLGQTCAGTPHEQWWETVAGGTQQRFVVRGPDRVTKTLYTYSGTKTVVPAGDWISYYVLGPGDVIACHPRQYASETSYTPLVDLGPAPPDLPGPLSISFT